MIDDENLRNKIKTIVKKLRCPSPQQLIEWYRHPDRDDFGDKIIALHILLCDRCRAEHTILEELRKRHDEQDKGFQEIPIPDTPL